MRHKRLLLLTGATGYIGGRLLNQLERSGYSIRCLTRRPETLKHRSSEQVQVVAADLLKVDTLDNALDGVDTAFYFVHSMGATSDFEEDDRQAALNFVGCG